MSFNLFIFPSFLYSEKTSKWFPKNYFLQDFLKVNECLSKNGALLVHWNTDALVQIRSQNMTKLGLYSEKINNSLKTVLSDVIRFVFFTLHCHCFSLIVYLHLLIGLLEWNLSKQWVELTRLQTEKQNWEVRIETSFCVHQI